MNKSAIKTFAVEARKKLIASVKDKAGMLGITKDKISEPAQKGADFETYSNLFGRQTTLTGSEITKRANLVTNIKVKGYDTVMEEVAYTWFNRLIAVRFMEVNDYLPARVRVLSSETKGKLEPDIITQAPNVDLNFTPDEIEQIIKLKQDNKLDELFRLLFIRQCNALNAILPELFERTDNEHDYSEMLLNINKIGNAQKHTIDEERAQRVMFVITTDGMENASREYNYDKVRQMIERQKEKYGWEFIFLGANIDAIATAARFGISEDRAANYHADSEGVQLNYEAVSHAVSSLRAGKSVERSWKAQIDEDYKNRKK